MTMTSDLDELMQKARTRAAECREAEGDFRSCTSVADGILSVICVHHVVSAKVQRVGIGWTGDVILDGLPPGYPNSLGTPNAFPRATPEEAVDDIVSIIAMIILIEEERGRGKGFRSDARGFDFHGINLMIPNFIFDRIIAVGTDPRPPEEIRHHLDEITADLFPGGVSPEAFEALPDPDKLRLISVVVYALTKDIFRHPEWRAPNADDTTPQRH